MTPDFIIRSRSRLDMIHDSLDKLNGQAPSHYPRFVGRVRTRVIQTSAAGQFIVVNPVNVLGVEAEGSIPTLVPDMSSNVFVDLLGTRIPSVGEDLICHYVDYRWVAERSDQRVIMQFGSIPGCVCRQIPVTLQVSVDGPCQGIFKACTLVYGATPPEFSDFEIGPNCYLSSIAFVDDFSSLSYRYILGCDGVSFTLSRLFLPSDVTTAFRDSSDYQWTIGLRGNVCSPFLLSNGTIYQGGNPMCLVVISQ
jgi:hypothetical protein